MLFRSGEGLAVGDAVRVRHDDGDVKLHTVVRSPWRLGHGKYVVGLSDVVGGYDLSRVVYQSIHNEADNPYGVSLMRSMEFVATILLQIQNATGQVWQRYGDPSLSLIYKTSNRKITGTDLKATGNEVAIETVVLAHEGLRRLRLPGPRRDGQRPGPQPMRPLGRAGHRCLQESDAFHHLGFRRPVDEGASHRGIDPDRAAPR